MAYYSYKRVRDILMNAGWIVYSDDMELVPANKEKYGSEIDNSYLGNLYDMIADYTDELNEAHNASN